MNDNVRMAAASLAVVAASELGGIYEDPQVRERKVRSEIYKATVRGHYTPGTIANERRRELRSMAGGREVRQLTQADTIARNDPCPCGSGKKWKKCHGR